MARSTFKVLFYLKRHAEQNGKAPIMGRITINGTNSQFSCKMSIPPKHGDTEANKAAGKSVVAQHINEKMENVKINIGKQYQRICDRYRIEYRDRRFLSESELRAVTNVYVPNYKTALVKNIFVFCCFTGLSYVDVKKLSQTIFTRTNGAICGSSTIDKRQ